MFHNNLHIHYMCPCDFDDSAEIYKMTQCIVVKSPSPISFAQSPIVRVASRLILATVFHMHRNSSHILIGYLFLMEWWKYKLTKKSFWNSMPMKLNSKKVVPIIIDVMGIHTVYKYKKHNKTAK